jgi:cephalosporin hydroxylase
VAPVADSPPRRGFRAYLRHALEYPPMYADALRVRRRLRSLPDDLPAGEALELARRLTWRGDRLRPTQATDEILWLLDIVKALRPRTVVEVGTDEGGTLFLWTRVVAPDAHLVAVDMRPLGVLGAWSRYAVVRRGLARHEQRIDLVMPADSQSPTTVERVVELLGGRPVDFLFIDGDHSYEGVKRDFELWSPLVRSGGIIVLHDVKPDHPTGVPQLWAELKERFDTEERVAGDVPSYGIGVVHVQ